jgi:hypothetical protein
VVGQWPGDLCQRRERQVRLGRHADSLDHLHPARARALAGAREQRGLADPGLAGDEESPPVARTGILQDTVDFPHLAASPEKHEVTLTPIPLPQWPRAELRRIRQRPGQGRHIPD